MKKLLISTFLFIILINSGCYTTFRQSRKVTPEEWQESHKLEIQHVVDSRCHKWDYYYHYPAWMQIGRQELTGYSKFCNAGSCIIDGICYIGSLGIEIAEIFSDDEIENDETCRKPKKLPKDREE